MPWLEGGAGRWTVAESGRVFFSLQSSRNRVEIAHGSRQAPLAPLRAWWLLCLYVFHSLDAQSTGTPDTMCHTS